jgi:TubC N-terminal docking domain
MSPVVEILSELAQRGVSVRTEGDSLKLRPAEALDEGLLERIAAHKPEILAALRRHPVTCAASCYEVEPGCWVHHPWDDCRTLSPAQPARTVEGQCYHCSGDGKCRCLLCCNPRNGGAGECVPCKGTGRSWVWLQ